MKGWTVIKYAHPEQLRRPSYCGDQYRTGYKKCAPSSGKSKAQYGWWQGGTLFDFDWRCALLSFFIVAVVEDLLLPYSFSPANLHFNEILFILFWGHL